MERIKYYDLKEPGKRVDLRSAVFNGVGSSGGLYMPEKIPLLNGSFFQRLYSMDIREIAFEISCAMFGDEIPASALKKITERALNYEIPLVRLAENISVLELFHGPTLAFKDTGARFMASLFEYLLESESREVTILVATSGDTGSAVANAFRDCEGIQVVILYPSGRVSRLQEMMLVPEADNIHSLEIEGDFDDCQKFVKQAFSDPDLQRSLNLTSANSINYARLFPQAFYYFNSIARLGRTDKAVVFSVPSGNFGNLTAGAIAYRMGLKLSRFIASSNSNHPVVSYLSSGLYEPGISVPTITNAMDVADPSNFPRLLSLFGNSFTEISSMINGFWADDNQTRAGMKELFSSFGYTSDPHTAIAYLGLKNFLAQNKAEGIFLSTAHPAKFSDEVELVTGFTPKIPPAVSKMISPGRKTVKLPASYIAVKEYLSDLGA